MSDELTLIAGVHQQNRQILQELAELKRQLQALQSQSPPVELWVVGYDRLHDALRQRGLAVSHVRLRAFRQCEVFREGEECRNFGTDKVPRWRFHVEKCQAAIARFELLPVHEQRRLLANKRSK